MRPAARVWWRRFDRAISLLTLVLAAAIVAAQYYVVQQLEDIESAANQTPEMKDYGDPSGVASIAADNAREARDAARGAESAAINAQQAAIEARDAARDHSY